MGNVQESNNIIITVNIEYNVMRCNHEYTNTCVDFSIYKPLFLENKFNTVTVAGYIMQCSLFLHIYAL